MKWIKSRLQYLQEAKLREEIYPKQAEQVKRQWGEKYLDYETPQATKAITQGKWKLSEEDKMKMLGAFFQCDMKVIFDNISSLPDKFCYTIAQSISIPQTPEPEKYEVVLKDFNMKEPSIDQIVAIYDNIFRKLNVNETMGDSMIQKDEAGRPVRDSEGQMVKITKEKGAPIFTNSCTNITSWCDDYNRCYPDDKVDTRVFSESNIRSLRNLAKEDCNGALRVDFEIFNKDLYLSISHNPKDILNMSISKFYNSCQNLYDGGYREQLLGNVFDPNSVPAFMTFDTPVFYRDEKAADQLPLSRTIVRNIELFDGSSKGIFFDRTYPDRCEKVFKELLVKYSGMQQTITDRDGATYLFTPDIDPSDTGVKSPYMDRLAVDRRPMIGVNCKSLYLSKVGDWSNIKISPDAKIKELVIETTSIPSNLLDLKLNLDWIKFKYLYLKDLKPFSSLITDSIAFDKCKLKNEVLQARKDDTIKLQLISCDIDAIDLSGFSKLEELHLLMTLKDLEELKRTLTGTKLKKLVISDEILGFSKTDRKMKMSEDSAKFLEGLRRAGVSVEIKGIYKK